MITKRASDERGHFDHGWLKTYHTFSFADYYDPTNIHFRALRVINEDWVEPGRGFGTHPHRDMEIVTVVLEGALQHKDSMGNGSIIRPGEVQRMSAGTGIFHSEFNPSSTEPVHLLQIWIIPEARNLQPEYEQKSFPREERINKLRLLASRDAAEGSVAIHQDAKLFGSVLQPGSKLEYPLAPERGAFVQVSNGSISLNGNLLAHGDSASIEQEQLLSIVNEGEAPAEFVLFDLG